MCQFKQVRQSRQKVKLPLLCKHSKVPESRTPKDWCGRSFSMGGAESVYHSDLALGSCQYRICFKRSKRVRFHCESELALFAVWGVSHAIFPDGAGRENVFSLTWLASQLTLLFEVGNLKSIGNLENIVHRNELSKPTATLMMCDWQMNDMHKQG